MLQLMVWQFLIVDLNLKRHTCGHWQAIWGMARQSSSAIGISQKQTAKC